MSNYAFVDSSSLNQTVSIVGNATQCSVCPNPPAAGVEYVATVNGGSMYTQTGATNYITIPLGSNWLNIGTGDFTMSFWVYPLSAAASWGNTILRWGGWNVYRITSTGGISWGNDGFGISSTPANTCPLNTWTHFAASRTSGTLKLFINGTQVTSISDGNNYTISTNELVVGGYGTAVNNWHGYISGVRVVVGTGLHTSNFTPDYVPTAVANTKLLLNFQTADIFDSRCKSPSYTFGGVATDIATYKYGNASLSFSGASGTYLLVPGSTDVWMGTGDFTIETWIRPTLITGLIRGIFGINTTASNSNGFALAINNTNSKIGLRIAGTTWGTLESSSTIPLNTWTHIAMVRTSGSVKVYINGVAEITTTSGGSTNFTAGDFVIGREYSDVDDRFQGNMDDFRVTKGLARYTGTFTPPSALPKK